MLHVYNCMHEAQHNSHWIIAYSVLHEAIYCVYYIHMYAAVTKSLCDKTFQSLWIIHVRVGCRLQMVLTLLEYKVH